MGAALTAPHSHSQPLPQPSCCAESVFLGEKNNKVKQISISSKFFSEVIPRVNFGFASYSTKRQFKLCVLSSGFHRLSQVTCMLQDACTILPKELCQFLKFVHIGDFVRDQVSEDLDWWIFSEKIIMGPHGIHMGY